MGCGYADEIEVCGMDKNRGCEVEKIPYGYL